MIPKSLLIAVVTGIVAAGALGIYLEKEGSKNGFFVDTSGFGILTDKQNYKLGEKVSIKLVNLGANDITFSNEFPSLQVRALDGTIFFSTSFDGVKITPQQTHIFEWNQQKNDNSKIIEGRYVIDSFAYDTNKQKINTSTTLTILK
jgi:hypothetical protein